MGVCSQQNWPHYRRHTLSAVDWFSVGAFAASAMVTCIMTYVGFLLVEIPVWVAYVPFGVAAVLANRVIRAGVAAGHFAVIAGISAWGLLSLGYAVWSVVPIALAALFILVLLYMVLGVAMASAVLLLVAWFPGNPLLMAGALYPGSGLVGLWLLFLCALLLERLGSYRAKAAVLLLICVAPATLLWAIHANIDRLADFRTVLAGEIDALDLPKRDIVSIKVDGDRSIDAAWSLQLKLADLQGPGTVITGENIVTADDISMMDRLCRVASNRDLALLLGIAAKDGRAEIWQMNPGACDAKVMRYRAVIGIPGLTGPMVVNPIAAVQETGLRGALLDNMGALACFEAFSVHRWAAMGRAGVDIVAVVSNDRWTVPIPVPELREKISRELARLFGLEVVHANTLPGSDILLVPTLTAGNLNHG